MKKNAPLAHVLRPNSLEEFVGQEHLVGENKPLRKLIENNSLSSSLIFWGPPGCGKTTLARIISKQTNSEFVQLSAVSAGKKDIEKVLNRSKLFMDKKVILFLDEIHRFNKAQQDFLLPYVENGTITLIGATTENPSFEVISALLSRSRVFVFKSLSENDLNRVVKRAVESLKDIEISADNIKLITHLSNGDARSALNILELSISLIPESSEAKQITREMILDSVEKSLRYDKDGEEHYNIISALHKSMRDSDPQGAVYWTTRMIEGGEDPKYIIRRMIRFASEDIGNADPNALTIATSAKQAVEFLGYPECDTALIQTAIYLAQAPKSNSTYAATLKAKDVIKRTGNLPVPLHLRNAPTSLMKELGYGKGYKYAHDYENVRVNQKHLPEEIEGEIFYEKKDSENNN